jgi:hypothetical protein
MTTNNLIALGIVVFALVLCASGANLAWKVQSALREGDSVSGIETGLDFDTAFYQYRRNAVVDVITALGSLVAAIGIYRDQRWGGVMLACVVSAHAVFQLSYRFLPGPSSPW